MYNNCDVNSSLALDRFARPRRFAFGEVPPRRALMRDADDERVTAAEARTARSAAKCDDDDDLVSSCPSVFANNLMPSIGLVMRMGGRAIR